MPKNRDKEGTVRVGDEERGYQVVGEGTTLPEETDTKSESFCRWVAE